jgi:hypothetical protein
MKDQIELAATMAGKWWADKLDEYHAEKREAFAVAVAKLVAEELRGDAYWVWNEGRKVGDGTPVQCVTTEVDYDPQGLMLDAVREVVEPNCRGMLFSARGILPDKHMLQVWPDKLVPKEGYGNWVAPIPVPKANPWVCVAEKRDGKTVLVPRQVAPGVGQTYFSSEREAWDAIAKYYEC